MVRGPLEGASEDAGDGSGGGHTEPTRTTYFFASGVAHNKRIPFLIGTSN